MSHGLRAGGHGRSKLGPPLRELPGRQLAEQNPAARLEAAHDLGVLFRHMVLAQLGVAGRRDSSGFDDVLEAVWDAVHRAPALARHQFQFRRFRLSERDILGEANKAVVLAVMRGDAVEQRARHLDR